MPKNVTEYLGKVIFRTSHKLYECQFLSYYKWLKENNITLHLLTYENHVRIMKTWLHLNSTTLAEKGEQLMDSGVVSIFWVVWINTQWNLLSIQTVHEKNAKILQLLAEFGISVLMFILYKVKLHCTDFKIYHKCGNQTASNNYFGIWGRGCYKKI